MNVFARVGAATIGVLRAAGRVAMFAGAGLGHCVSPPFHGRQIVRQLIDVGYYSLPVVALTRPSPVFALPE